MIPGERPVLAADGDSLERLLAGDVEGAMRGEGCERSPLVLGIGDCRGQRMLAPGLGSFFFCFIFSLLTLDRPTFSGLFICLRFARS